MQYFTIQLKVNSRYCYVMPKTVGFKWQKIFSPMIRSHLKGNTIFVREFCVKERNDRMNM